MSLIHLVMPAIGGFDLRFVNPGTIGLVHDECHIWPEFGHPALSVRGVAKQSGS